MIRELLTKRNFAGISKQSTQEMLKVMRRQDEIAKRLLALQIEAEIIRREN